ncbi:MAG TPA: hypothetical protein VGK29_14225 [Paludibaculum sp.]
MTNATPTKYRRVRRGATSTKGPVTAPETTTEPKAIYSTEALRDAAFAKYKPQGLVETSIVEQIAKTLSIIQKFTYAFPLDALLDDYFAGARKLSNAELSAALRESANRDRIIDEGFKLIARATRELAAYRKSLMSSNGDTVDILTFRLH